MERLTHPVATAKRDPRKMEPTTKLVIGIDIGGTKVARGLVDACGEIHVRSRTPMITAGEASKGLAAVSAAIQALFSALLNDRELKR